MGLDSILRRGDERPALGECRLADGLASDVEGVIDGGPGSVTMKEVCPDSFSRSVFGSLS